MWGLGFGLLGSDRMSKSTQLVVIGAGPGGYAAAFYAADRGMSVTLVDPEKNPGALNADAADQLIEVVHTYLK